MTDETTFGGPPAPGAPADPAATKSGKLRPVIIIGVIVAFLAIVLFVVRNNVAADDLKVGECFIIPNGTTVMTVASMWNIGNGQ